MRSLINIVNEARPRKAAIVPPPPIDTLALLAHVKETWALLVRGLSNALIKPNPEWANKVIQAVNEAKARYEADRAQSASPEEFDAEWGPFDPLGAVERFIEHMMRHKLGMYSRELEAMHDDYQSRHTDPYNPDDYIEASAVLLALDAQKELGRKLGFFKVTDLASYDGVLDACKLLVQTYDLHSNEREEPMMAESLTDDLCRLFPLMCLILRLTASK